MPKDEWRRTLLLLCVLVAVAGVLAACGGADEDESSRGGALREGSTYKIGFAQARTGDLAILDLPTAQGLQLAVDEVNRRGGVDGRVRLELDARDMRSQPAQGATVTQDLIDDGAQFLVQVSDADVALPGAQVAARNNLPVMSNGGDATFPSKVPGGWGFMMFEGIAAQAAVLAERAFQEGHRRVFVMSSRDLVYTTQAPNAFVDRFRQLGGQVVGSASYNLGDRSFRATATRIRAANPDVVFTPGFPPDVIAFFRDLERVGVEAPVYLANATIGSMFDSGRLLEESVNVANAFPQGESARRLETAYRARFGKSPAEFGTDLGTVTAAYTAGLAIAEAIRRAQSTDPQRVRDALSQLDQVPGAPVPISYRGSRGVPRTASALTRFDLGDRSFPVIDPQIQAREVPAPR